MTSQHRRRGVVLFFFVVVFVGGALTGAAVYDGLSGMENAEAERSAAAQGAAQDARRALVNYMLSRPSRPFNIARPGGSGIPPRLLMLPCPDNLGDNNLDGTQDPTCGADGGGANMTNGVLSSGARFGRLPYRQKFLSTGEAEVSDGLGGDFRDDGLWYAVSRNFAPANNGAPLNLHRLDAQENEWLSVERFAPDSNPQRLTLNQRVAAVVLSPGRHAAGRLPESLLATASLSLSDIPASLYFESAGGESNADADGVFVLARPSRDISEDAPRGFDDYADYIGMDELLRPRGRFMRAYLAATGAGDAHNAPADGSPLQDIRRALTDWKNFFGFYPLPAANTAAHINERARHCAAHHTDADATVVVSGITLLSPAETIVNAPSATAAVAATLQNDSGFLIAHPARAEMNSPLAVVLADNTLTVAGTITLARYARLTLTAGTEILADPPLISANVLQPGAEVVLQNTAVAFVAENAPLSPAGTPRGWLPEHHKTTMIIAHDGARLSIHAPTTAGFLGAAALTSAARSVTLSSRSRLSLYDAVKMEEDFSQVKLLYEDALLIGEGATITLLQNLNYKPDGESFARRHFVVLQLSDIFRGGGTVFAPNVLYPWREKETASAAAITRDNLHPYPPCFDSRSLPRRARAFLEDQNLYYAVSPGCHDGGACGGAITITTAAGVRFAAPSPFTLTHSFTATIGGGTVTFDNGEVDAILTNGIAANSLIVVSEFALSFGTGAAAELSAGFVLRVNERTVIPAGATITAGDRTRVENAEAVLIFSPAPLSASRCVAGMPDTYISAATVSLATQGGGGADLTIPCQWLDEDENADGDLLFVLRPPAPPAQANDYFLFFGGQVRIE